MIHLAKSLVNRFVPEGRVKEALRYLHHRAAGNGGVDIRYDRRSGAYVLRFQDPRLAKHELRFPIGNISDLLGMGKEIPPYFTEPLKEDTFVVDAGAYPGEFSTLASRMIGDGIVVALEPDPKNRVYFQRMQELNSLGNIIPSDYALSGKNGPAYLLPNGVESRVVDPENLTEEEQARLVQIETATLDALTRDPRERGLQLVVKMDIEGHELEALRGAGATLKYGAHFIIAAYHEVDGEQTHGPVGEILDLNGYEVKKVNAPHTTIIAKPK